MNGRKPTSTQNIRTIDLFSGVGGSSWGARLAGAKIVAAFDHWTLAGESIRVNFPEAKFVPVVLEKAQVVSAKRQFGRIDLILASPECTNHSPAKGSRPRCEESKNTAFQVVRFAKALSPRWIVVENVVSMRRWSRFAEFKQALVDLGYALREQVLDSVDFGVPQSRRRLFLTADLEREPPEIRSTLPRKAASEIVAADDEYPWAPLRSKARSQATIERAERAIEAVGMQSRFLLVYYGSDGAGGWQTLDRPLRTITTVDRFAIVRPDGKGGHLMRMLQVPELKMAMGMPISMKIEAGTRRDRIKMIGNAVCPPVMRAVVSKLTRD